MATASNFIVKNGLTVGTTQVANTSGYWTGSVHSVSVGGTGVTTSTGSGSAVLNTSPSITSSNLVSPKFQSYSEVVSNIGNVSGSVSVDLGSANIFIYTLIGSTTFTFTNPPASNISKPVTLIIRQDGVGSRTASFTGAKWTDGTAPTLTTTANKYDVFTFFTVDGGSSYFATYAMANVT